MTAAVLGRHPPTARSLLRPAKQHARLALDFYKRLLVIVDDRLAEVDERDRVGCNCFEKIGRQIGKSSLGLIDDFNESDRSQVEHRNLLQVSADAVEPLSSTIPGHVPHVVDMQGGFYLLRQSRRQRDHPDCSLDALNPAQELLAHYKTPSEPDGQDAAAGLNPCCNGRPVCAFAYDLYRNAHDLEAATILARAA